MAFERTPLKRQRQGLKQRVIQRVRFICPETSPIKLTRQQRRILPSLPLRKKRGHPGLVADSNPGRFRSSLVSQGEASDGISLAVRGGCSPAACRTRRRL